MTKHRLSKRDILVDEITMLREEYQERYGVSVFELPMPCILDSKISLGQMVEILKNIVDTGENIYEGYQKYILKHQFTLNELSVSR